MTIYIDLDDCLIHSVFGETAGQERTRMELGEEQYSMLERPHAQQMLKDLRSIGPLRMLTTATPEYAHKVNKIFKFEFEPEDIISLTPLLVKVQLAYGSDIILTKTHTDPRSILIDHQDPQDQWLRRKILYLGIKSGDYVKIREFDGIDPPDFTHEWRNLHMTQITHLTTQERNL